jgi:hypothetical protein
MLSFWLNGNIYKTFNSPKIALVFPVFPYSQNDSIGIPIQPKRKHWYSHTTKKDNIGIPIQQKT